LELSINDVPLTISVELYSRVKKARNDSFRSLAPSGQPRETQSVDPATGEVFEDSEIRKGVKVGKGFVPMTAEALEAISSGVKTEVVPARRFAPVDTIAFDLAIDRYAVRPDPDVKGSGPALNIVWNGLREAGVAWTEQVSLTGGHDAILAIYADEKALWAALLPFQDELYPVPTHTFETDGKAATLFNQMLRSQFEVEEFDHAEFVSEYRARRQAAIDAVVAGEEVPEQPKAEAKDEGIPDLMAALEASVTATKSKPAAKKTARKKVTA
jgi:non-homologous end joining protein Ku